ncbi:MULTISPECIES: hypothetical protein [Rhodopirellula]|uniref:Uncharacterized protein n=4 Tax=Rhodopirellula TaxID=265488 RepID=M2AVE1_9BACT|nr:MULTISPECIES: hypothetical protein [Rhodopirellula]MAP10209.1 hypothetical protein [Rhodopirellula sp.]MCR9209874.1 hypothetical protein [bacterium]EGF23921.1 hypothetical protein RBWH47_05477 [Rhodopirellula baltica WH47]ELP33545.1 hypothetical protein RBSWK_02447 [Rhodopirellula baltica SWK14]EMB13959.1 hypothetical protein RE6C_05336 [Rhodopirellula europaea 6C]
MTSLTARHQSKTDSTDLKQARREMELDRMAGLGTSKTVSLPLSQVARLLIDAAQSNRTWLMDFADDVVRIDSDLYEVLLAYQELRSDLRTA